jgi:hypothetical protein
MRMQTEGNTHPSDERRTKPCDSGSSSIVRNRYFYSMLLEWPDMAQDQGFHLGNARRHAAELHGFGTVCGLRVEKTQCHEQVRLKKGVAIDCLGREIRVERDVLVDLHDAVARAVEERRKKPKPEHERGKKGQRDHEHDPHEQDYDQHGHGHDEEEEDDDDDDGCEDPVDVYVGLCYREVDERPVQAIGGPETCCKPACEMSRTRHGWHVEVSLEPPKIPPRIRDLIDDLYECEHERLGEWLCRWITEPCWQCTPDPCGRDHKCLGLARVRVVPNGSVESIDNCCIRPLVLPTVMIAALAQYAVQKTGREE